MNLKNIITLLILLTNINCNGVSKIKLKYYNSNSENEQMLLLDSANKFNALIGCEAVTLEHVEKTKEAIIGNGISEIQILESDVMNILAENQRQHMESTKQLRLLFLKMMTCLSLDIN